ncbi:MAG TPA: ADP-ribosylglycohydrolase family protein [Gemmatimonadales bacterium]|nr:ADP-ribosylglycohydrolase family protein [Gemmatimonadales bacterium]
MAQQPAPPDIATRARAAMLGLVAGSQLGTHTARLGTPEAIRAEFPDGVWDPPAPPKNSPYGAPAALALLLAESLVERGEFDAADVAERWVRWMKKDGRGLDAGTRGALRLIDRGTEPFEAGRQSRADETKRGAAASTVTRCLPIAIRFHDNADRLIRAATQQAALTDADPRSMWGAAAVCLAARELLHGNLYFVDEVVHRLEDHAPRPLLEALRRVPREQQEDLPIAVPGEMGYVVHAVETGFWFTLHDRALEDTLVYLAQAGGDTDGNAALAGALTGARYGEVGIPPRWMPLIVGAPGVTALVDRLLAR